MIIKISDCRDKNYIYLSSEDSRFTSAWGQIVKIPVSNVYVDLHQITFWAKKELGEDVSFVII